MKSSLFMVPLVWIAVFTNSYAVDVYCPIAFDTYEHRMQVASGTGYAGEKIEAGDINANPGRDFDVDGVGYFYKNKSGSTVRAFRITFGEDQNGHPMPANLKFRIEDCNGVELFNQITVAADGRSVTFSHSGGGANIPPESYIFIHFNRRYINGASGPRVYYRGAALTTAPADNHDEPADLPKHLLSTWKGFWLNCPSDLRDLSAWAPSQDGDSILAFSRGRCLLYSKGKLLEVMIPERNKDIPFLPNRITFDETSSQFSLWRNASRIGAIDAKRPVVVENFAK